QTDAAGKPIRDKDRVPGRWSLDRAFDGRTRTRPDGIIYVVTGAGGNRLYNPEQTDDSLCWHDFTDKFLAKGHSLTVADGHATSITIRQLAADGQELDRWVVTR